MSGIGTTRLRSGLKERHIVYANYENEKVNIAHAPIIFGSLQTKPVLAML